MDTYTDLALKEFFFTIIDDTHDLTHTYQLLSLAKNKVERMYKPLILQDTDSSQTRAFGDTYLTMKNLPADFRLTISMYVGTRRHRAVPFAKRVRYKDASGRFYIDLKNSQFGITGVGAVSEPIDLTYLIKTPDLTEATAAAGDATITWPDEFRPLVAYEAAMIFQSGLDADTTAFRMSERQMTERQALLDSFIDWDADQKNEEMDGTGGFDDEEDQDVEFPLGLM